MSINEDLLSKFEEIKVLLETLQTDVVKHAGGNASAGVRARKGLREVKKLASAWVKESVDTSKEKE